MSHITQEQRYTISLMLNQGFPRTAISLAVGKDKSVISREIKRNKDQRSGEYRAELAQRKYIQRQSRKSQPRKFNKDMQQYVDSLIEQDYSPEQIVGISKKNNKECVSHETIYQYIWIDKKHKGTLHLHLRHKGRKYRKRGSYNDSRGIIRDRVGIEQRPEIVEKRSRFGDIEADLIIGKNHQQAILTLNDRASGVLKMKKIESKEAKVVSQAMNQLLEEWMPYIKTITSDNGKEFAEHKLVSETLNIDYFFARPYHSWERGSNENLNGLIRQYFPKKHDFNLIDEQMIKDVETKINNRPRKRFNFENPLTIMDKLLFNKKVAFCT